MPHIHTEPGQHDLTASAFIVQLYEVEPQLLLHRHKKLGVYLQFGGHVELDETPWQALYHEVKEESGYSLDSLQVLQPSDALTHLSNVSLHPHPAYVMTAPFIGLPHEHIDIGYALTATVPPDSMAAKDESQEFVSVTLKELMALSDEDIYENVKEIGSYILTTCLQSWQPVDASTFAH